MRIVEAVVAMAIVPVIDWIVVTGCAARFSNFDYRYWTPNVARVISVSLLAITAAVLIIFANPDYPPLWLLIPASIPIFAWGIVGYRDILAQRRTGYRIPPSYGERE